LLEIIQEHHDDPHWLPSLHTKYPKEPLVVLPTMPKTSTHITMQSQHQQETGGFTAVLHYDWRKLKAEAGEGRRKKKKKKGHGLCLSRKTILEQSLWKCFFTHRNAARRKAQCLWGRGAARSLCICLSATLKHVCNSPSS